MSLSWKEAGLSSGHRTDTLVREAMVNLVGTLKLGLAFRDIPN